MKISGVIAEFNPFHNGHRYLLDQMEGLKIVALSGNFVQRGEPAFVDKWVRAQMALSQGADLVLELPFLVSVQAADFFAAGAVDILVRAGVEELVFGTEEVRDYNALLATYQARAAEMTAYMDQLPNSLSFPQKSQAAWEQFLGLTFTGQSPNHILGLAYTKAAAETNLTLKAIQRQGAGFHSLAKDQSYASATALRHHRADQAFVQQHSPVADLLATVPQQDWSLYWPLVRYQILSHPNLQDIYQVNEEVAQRLLGAVGQVDSVEELVAAVATKRFTKARVRRILTYVLVGAQEAPLPESLRVLGFSSRGRQHLALLKKQVNWVTRIGAEPWDALTQKADQIYSLGQAGIGQQNFGRVPLQWGGE
ncbi:nucleotidyltransferase [Streptococcus danieliae]|uniref:tRNA(Met) cytidine acetate ligase n=1 Tax=Streptococcus danieliae TaxID=747656 RepID=A0A7X3G829_9STRE|nr:nucleotidyltransferase [Streptococcus danieliae]MVX58745.1 nucleotidyltransferase [Streptococcus danieliae]NYS32951.1 nucleotidyltransferase [Streptococcus danieliae]